MRSIIVFALFVVAFAQCSLLLGFQESDGSSEKMQAKTFEVVVEAGDLDRVNEIVQTRIASDANAVVLKDEAGNKIIGQLSDVGEEGIKELTFVVPKLAAGETLSLSATPIEAEQSSLLQWHDDGVGEAALMRGDQNIMKYMYSPIDETNKETRMQTYKVFHHVYSPNGEELVTKGPGGLFPHHRGLFYGFSRISYDGKKADTWHCKKGAHQSHQESLNQVAGPIMGRHTVALDWHGEDGVPFAREQRQMSAMKLGQGTLIEFNSHLESLGSDIKLDGDPQHAGFQFRASQRVPDETKAKTFYIRPDGKAEPGQFRNWSAKKDESEENLAHVNLPWNALNFWVGENNYTCCYLDLDSNPKESRFSERDYGRFGSYFVYKLTPDTPLNLRYRIWLQDGEMTVDKIDAMHKAFQTPAKVTVNGQ